MLTMLLSLSVCHITDKMMCSYLDYLQKRFIEQGGLKERMYAARTGYRQKIDSQMKALKSENAALKEEIKRLKELLKEKKG